MIEHTVTTGDRIISNKKSPIWIDKGEEFVVTAIVKSELTGNLGVSFIDRTGSKRVFWRQSYYTINNDVI